MLLIQLLLLLVVMLVLVVDVMMMVLLVHWYHGRDVRSGDVVFVERHHRCIPAGPVVDVVVRQREGTIDAGIDPEGVQIVADRVIHCGGRLGRHLETGGMRSCCS